MSQMQRSQAEMSSSKIRAKKQQREAIEKDIKMNFLEKLFGMMERRMDHFAFQTNILRKKKKLYNIYGGKNASMEMDYGINSSVDGSPVMQDSLHDKSRNSAGGFDSMQVDENNLPGAIALAMTMGFPEAQLKVLRQKQ